MQKKKKVAKKKASRTKPVITGDYLVDVVTEMTERLMKGEIKATAANAVAKQQGLLIQRAKVQLDILKFTGGNNKNAAKKLLN